MTGVECGLVVLVTSGVVDPIMRKDGGPGH